MKLLRRCAQVVAVLIGGAGTAQQPEPTDGANEWALKAEAWLADPGGDEARDEIAELLLKVGPAGFHWLATKLAAVSKLLPSNISL